MIILKTEKVLPGNGQLPYPRQSEKIGRLSLDNCGGQSFLFCLLSMYCNKPSPSQALPRQLSQGESQAVRFITEVLGAMRKFPAVLLPLPLGEVASRSDDGEGEPAKVKTQRQRGCCTMNRSLSSRQTKKQNVFSRISEMRSWFSFMQLPASCGSP